MVKEFFDNENNGANDKYSFEKSHVFSLKAVI